MTKQASNTDICAGILCKATHNARMMFYSSNPKYKTN